MELNGLWKGNVMYRRFKSFSPSHFQSEHSKISCLVFILSQY